MQIRGNKRNCLHTKGVHLPQDLFGTQTLPPLYCFGTPIWPPWCHVKTLYWTIGRATDGPMVGLSVISQQQCYAEVSLLKARVYVTQETKWSTQVLKSLRHAKNGKKKKFVYISLLNTNSWHVVRISGIGYEKSSSERLFGISSHRGACSSSSCCNLK